MKYIYIYMYIVQYMCEQEKQKEQACGRRERLGLDKLIDEEGSRDERLGGGGGGGGGA